MKNKNFEKELPQNYKLALHLNAKDVKLGLIFNLVAVLVSVVIIAIAIFTISINDGLGELYYTLYKESSYSLIIYASIFLFGMIFYIVTHELLHGIFYKLFTGEKLTFGASWSCFFCGVPKIYIYRRPAMIAASAPLVFFTILLIPLTAWLYYVNYALYLLSAMILGLHLGGCAGDIYVILLFLFKFRGNKTLVRDTGPEQFFYVGNR